MFSETVAGMLPTRSRSASPNGPLEKALARLQEAPFYDVRHIGESYLQTHPEEADRDHLLTTLQSEARQNAPRAPCRLDQQVQRDFASDRTVRVNGWVLSHTEARLCALATLS